MPGSKLRINYKKLLK